MQVRLPKLSECMVVFDFDNTITYFDVLDDIIERFSINRDWVGLENAWRKNLITSRQCLEGQLKSIRVSKKQLELYLSLIKIDPRFHKFISLLKEEGMKPVILSDNFSFIINSILRNNGITGVTVKANSLKIKNDRLIPVFSRGSKSCVRCGHCKKNTLMRNVDKNVIIYIGDGLSDVCPAECSDLAFAKDKLLEHFRRTKRLCMAFNDLGDIYNYFRGLEKW